MKPEGLHINFARDSEVFMIPRKFQKLNLLLTVNVLKLRTLKNNYFLTVRNFRNYVSEKVLVFVNLECGLYQEQKRYICM